MIGRALPLPRRALFALALGLLGATLACGGDEVPEPSLEERLEADDRIRPLLVPCHHGKTFAADTSDMMRVLANNLVFSEVEPLRRSKAELAEAGEAAVPDLRRVFDESYADRWQHGVLENVLGVCALMQGPAGIGIARDGLRHPHEGVRLSALDAVRKHGAPEDYDLLVFNIGVASTEENRADFATALHAVDRERFYLEFIDWLEQGQWPDLWRYLAPLAAKASDPVTLARYAVAAGVPDAGAATGLDPDVRPFLLAALAASGKEDALHELRAELSADNPKRREVALRAAEQVGLVDEVRTILEQDDLEAFRARAASIIGELGGDDVLDALRGGLSDPGPTVREVCLQQLVQRGDGPARAQALEMLRQGIRERAEGMRALRLLWQTDTSGADRAYDILTSLFREQSEDTSEAVGLLQTLSQVPTRAAAEFLMEIGLNAKGQVRGWPVHRWCAFQVFNVGPLGLAYLRELHAAESDPFRRLDYLAAIWQDHSDEARATLRGVVQDERSTPYEKLFAADRLVRIGPAQEQAPFLKRALYFESTHERVRPALQCLLWRWYGA